jgi:small subunit ribosomal protein S20
LANSKSARKRIRVAQRRHDSRRPYISACRTMVKKAVLAIQNGDDTAAVAVVGAVRMLDRTAGKGIIHRNNAARRKSRLMQKFNARSQAAG